MVRLNSCSWDGCISIRSLLSHAEVQGGRQGGDKSLCIFSCRFNKVNVRDFAASKTNKAHFHWNWETALWAIWLRAQRKRSRWPNHRHRHVQWGTETAPPYNDARGQKLVRRSDSSCRSQSTGSRPSLERRADHHNLAIVIFTLCNVERKGWKTKQSPKDKMQLEEHAWYQC